MPSPSCARRTVGRHGHNVFLFERVPGGTIYARLGQATARCLYHRDWARAEREAYHLLSLTQSPDPADGLSLGHLVTRYRASSVAAQWTLEYAKEVQRVLAAFCAFYNLTQRVDHLTPDMFARYTASRAGSCRMGRIHKDFAILRAACTWARGERAKGGDRLLLENPFDGYTLPQEKNPRRVVLTEEDYQALRAGAAESFRETFALLLDVMEGTGKRFQQVARLEPGHLGVSRILWAAESEKTRREVTSIVAPELLQRLAAHGNARWVFPAEQDPHKPLAYTSFKNWFTRTARRLKLQLPKGAGAHSLRRKWATERADYDVATLQKAGGWKHRDSLIPYQGTDQHLVDQAVLHPTRLVTRAGIVDRPLSGKMTRKSGTKSGTGRKSVSQKTPRKTP